MIKLIKVLLEQNIIKTTQVKPVVDAIKNRRKISFYYSGPRTPKKISVKPGKRILVEPVAIGLTKRGILAIKAWVEPPSVSKKGFDSTTHRDGSVEPANHWRTFLLSRTRDLQISDEIFDTKRPGYKEGDDSSFTVTYATVDWGKKPRIKKYEKPTEKPVEPKVKPKEPEVKPTEKPVEPTPEKPEVEPEELPQPKQKTKPSLEPPTVQTAKPEPEEVPQAEPKTEPSIEPENPEEENETLKESIRRIKTLMLI